MEMAMKENGLWKKWLGKRTALARPFLSLRVAWRICGGMDLILVRFSPASIHLLLPSANAFEQGPIGFEQVAAHTLVGLRRAHAELAIMPFAAG